MSADTGHAPLHTWPPRFKNVKPGDRLLWKRQGGWKQARVLAIDQRDWIHLEVLGREPHIRHTALVRSSDAPFFEPMPTRGADPGRAGSAHQPSQGAGSDHRAPTFSFLDPKSEEDKARVSKLLQGQADHRSLVGTIEDAWENRASCASGWRTTAARYDEEASVAIPASLRLRKHPRALAVQGQDVVSRKAARGQAHSARTRAVRLRRDRHRNRSLAMCLLRSNKA